MARFVSVVRQSIASDLLLRLQLFLVPQTQVECQRVPMALFLSILVSNTTANSQNVTVQLVKSGATVTGSLITSGTVPNQSSLEFMTVTK
jgi:hypothetical protein